MEIEVVKNQVQALLSLLTESPSCYEIDNGKLNYIEQGNGVLDKLTALNIEILESQLDFSQFVIPKILLDTNYDQRLEASSVDEDFAVIDIKGHGVLYYEKQFYDFKSSPLLSKVENAINYYALYNKLKSPEFADHHNSADEEIIIYSSGKGILKIKYDTVAPTFDSIINHKVKALLNALEDQQFKTYFKNSLFDIAQGNIITLAEIITYFNLIISSAKRDLEIALRQFDFEKFKDALYSQKERFFTDIRDVLSKIYGQVVGIPISITAAVFATYKTTDTTVVPMLIMVSFLTYVAIYIFVQLNYYSDIKEIQTDFLRDFHIIKTQSGLPEADVTKEYNKIDRKILTTINISLTLMWAIGILGSLVVLFIILQL